MRLANQGTDGSSSSSDLVAPLVSVIIPTRNSANTIADCLRSINAQSYKPIEIIVVDCFSSDSTREIANNMGALVIPQLSERSEAKNLGAKCSKGKYLYFVDADHLLGPDVIATCVRIIDRADAVLINDQDIANKSITSRLVASRRRILSYDALSVAPRFVKKTAFDNLGGFDTDLIVGEDLDFHRRFLLNRFKLAYSGATVLHLGSPIDLKGLLNRSMYYSPNYVRYASKNPLISLKRISPLRTISAWKKSEVRGSDLLPVVLLGFLSNAFLIIGVLLNLRPRDGTWKEAYDS